MNMAWNDVQMFELTEIMRQKEHVNFAVAESHERKQTYTS